MPYASTPLERIRRAARELLDEGDASAWGVSGRLTTAELSNPFLTAGPAQAATATSAVARMTMSRIATSVGHPLGRSIARAAGLNRGAPRR